MAEDRLTAEITYSSAQAPGRCLPLPVLLLERGYFWDAVWYKVSSAGDVDGSDGGGGGEGDGDVVNDDCD